MKNLFYAAMLFFFNSCSHTSDDKTLNAYKNSTVNFKYVKDVNLLLDEKTPNWSVNSQYYYNNKTGEEFIILQNELANSIQFYDLNGKKVKEAFFKKTGPQSTGPIQGFLFQSEDSLYILNNQTNKVFRASSSAAILQSYQLPLPSFDSFFIIPWVEDGVEMYVKDRHLYISGSPGINYEKNRNDFYKNGLLSLDLNLVDGKTKYQIPYPNTDILKYKDFTTKLIRPKCIANENRGELIYSFGADHYVYIYTTNGKLKQKQLLDSQFLDKKIEPIRSRYELGDPLKEMLYYVNNASYDRLFYDTYKKMYYRLVKHKLREEYTGKDFQMGKQPEFKFSIIIADESFKILGECQLDKGKGLTLFIVTKDGVLIQKNQSGNEDTMSFEFYKIANNNE